ncbi:universal stress protein [Halopelagius longus]|uniref:Universal stress protein n=1 Tax=Halopelagius longus TaxID=1236180 RepID=A0A1H1DW85_9EURY|nr:universal stress protein [Halopelagius longus]RDI71497.1 universal stress protein [Halopelagius longus]SDQ80744.1 Nucleotide-binding universal stress protein, UspA family [Halopelagius longus]
MQYLVAVDGSESSIEALEHAIGVASLLDAELTLVYSVEPRILVDEGGDAPSFPEASERLYTEDIAEAESRGERVLEDAVERAREADVDADSELLYGDPVDTIAEYADEEGMDGVFVGHRGLSKRAQGLVGSVATGLVERANVPVTVVR